MYSFPSYLDFSSNILGYSNIKMLKIEKEEIKFSHEIKFLLVYKYSI